MGFKQVAFFKKKLEDLGYCSLGTAIFNGKVPFVCQCEITERRNFCPPNWELAANKTAFGF